MGESKRKQQHAEVQLKLWDTIAAHALPCSADLEPVVALAFNLDDAAQVRQALGGLPDACEELLRHRPARGEDARATGVFCQRGLSGRVEAHLTSSVESREADFLMLPAQEAAVRGCSLRLAAFPSGAWADAVAQCNTELEGQVRQTVRTMKEVSLLGKSGPRGGVLAITVPHLEAQDPRFSAVLAHMLRAFDEMVASKNALGQYFGRVMLGFTGYDEDSREVWEVESCARLLEHLNVYAPFWPWLVAPQQLVMWLGALARNSDTVYSRSKQAAFDVDEELAAAISERAAVSCQQLLRGLNAQDEPEMLQRLQVMVRLLSSARRGTADLYAELQVGGVAAAGV